MKRVKAACICQTLHFTLKEDIPHGEAVKLVEKEVESYKRGLDNSGSLYKLLEERTENDGSVMIKLIKQYNSSPVGDYLN